MSGASYGWSRAGPGSYPKGRVFPLVDGARPDPGWVSKKYYSFTRDYISLPSILIRIAHAKMKVVF